MAGKNDNFMQSREAQVLLYGITMVICAFYAVDAVCELLDPARSAALIENIGATMYYVLTGARLVACVWAAVAFGRMAWRLVTKDER